MTKHNGKSLGPHLDAIVAEHRRKFPELVDYHAEQTLSDYGRLWKTEGFTHLQTIIAIVTPGPNGTSTLEYWAPFSSTCVDRYMNGKRGSVQPISKVLSSPWYHTNSAPGIIMPKSR